MRVALLIAAKDLRLRIRDRSIFVIAVLAPFGLAFIFSRLIGPSASFHPAYVVADLDGGAIARAFRTQVVGGLADAGFATVADAPTEDEARAMVGHGSDAAFVIPQGFSAAVTSGRPSTIEIVGANDSELATEVARSIAERFGQDVAAAELSVATVAELRGAPPSQADAERIVAAARATTPPVQLVDQAATLRQLDLASYFSASMAILFLFFAAQSGMLSLFAERREGTLARMLAGPVQPRAILFGKLLGAAATSVVALGILVVATTALIGADWGAPVGVVPLLLGIIVAALGVSALVVSLARSEATAAAASSAVGLTLAIFGGTFTPSGQGPELMAQLSLLTPHGWFLRGLGELHGPDAVLGGAWMAALVLVAIGLVTGAIGILRAQRLVTAT